MNEVITNLSTILKINHHRSAPYYPQSNGRIERVVGTIKPNLKKMEENLRPEEDNKKVAWAGSSTSGPFGIPVYTPLQYLLHYPLHYQSQSIVPGIRRKH